MVRKKAAQFGVLYPNKNPDFFLSISSYIALLEQQAAFALQCNPVLKRNASYLKPD
jgi:hypothetical protein